MWISVAGTILGSVMSVVIMMQLARLNKQLSNISKKVREYMDAVCQPEEKMDRLDITLTPDEKKVLLSTPSEVDEKIFNEVLQEMFQ